jgi:hypothetical protein
MLERNLLRDALVPLTPALSRREREPVSRNEKPSRERSCRVNFRLVFITPPHPPYGHPLPASGARGSRGFACGLFKGLCGGVEDGCFWVVALGARFVPSRRDVARQSVPRLGASGNQAILVNLMLYLLSRYDKHAPYGCRADCALHAGSIFGGSNGTKTAQNTATLCHFFGTNGAVERLQPVGRGGIIRNEGGTKRCRREITRGASNRRFEGRECRRTAAQP